MKTPKPIMALLGLNPSGDLGDYTVYTSRRKGIVWFVKAPPKCPPTYLQRRQRNAFTLAALCWRRVSSEARRTWSAAARLAGLKCSGYNLFVFFQLTRDRAAIRTIEHQTGKQLL